MGREQTNSKPLYEEKIKNELNLTLRREIKDARLTFISFTRVNLNQDYSIAQIFWDTFDPTKKDEIKTALTGVNSKLRSVLAKNLKFRHTPELHFFYDSQFEDEKKIEDLLSKE